ncbi:uncharacterized protein LOC127795817 [Diospyros lotus]|uniref:uncharacterized protein LOC127795817 n=1 Tax=Diospyros lotus TaxID=55363 RepID=UPI002252DC1D|nr:uncharacterized protein LOC127795817 [Diospyros lotus]
MADVVQYKLERMVDELDDLERRGLFTRREISEIVKQRRKFEYRLKRPSPLKHDFLTYIDYEKSLDALRLLRKKAVARQLQDQRDVENDENKKKIKMKKSVSDFAGVSRILEIYRLATTRFKGDLELWFQYLEFCRQRKNGRMKKVLAQVIRFHPKVPGVWIYAAAWEFDQNLNAAAARSIMQSGLRACPTSEDLWVEYLRMELTYLNKLKARKVALGEDEGTLTRNYEVAEENQWRDENKELFVALDKSGDNDESAALQNEESKKLDLFQEQGLSILQTIYGGAVEALPSSLSLRKRFVEILEAINLGRSEEMRKEILADMKRDFAKDPEYWDWLARLEITNSTSTQVLNKEITPARLDKAIQVYEEAIEVLPSDEMFSRYTRFLREVIGQKNGDAQSPGAICPSGHALDLISHTLVVYERAESEGCITEDLACQYVSFYMQARRLEEARKLAEKLCNGKLSNAVELWVLRLSLEMRCVTERSGFPSKADLMSVFELLKSVLREMAVWKAKSLWLMGLKYFANQKHYFDKLVELALVSLTKDGGSDNGFSLSSTIINFVLQKDGIQYARDMYKRFLALPRPGLVIYQYCIELEANLASAGDRDGLLEARKLYESALATYKQDVSLWQNYYSMESKMGTSETANAIYWRARKSLKDKVALLSSAHL